MKRSDFNFRLPDALIAQQPPSHRGDSRLLCLDRHSGDFQDREFTDIEDLLQPGDLLVLNDTRVIPARLFARKETGGSVEILLERFLGRERMLCQLKASKRPLAGTLLLLENGTRLEVEGRVRQFFRLALVDEGDLQSIIDSLGHVPLPPYIKRADSAEDRERYQTVYARSPGAVAAPTAGLHFAEDLLQRLEDRGLGFAFVTLHVAAGTFQPVRSDDIEDHRMHSEWFRLDRLVCEQVMRTKESGGRVIAVGTTTVRCLETAAREGAVHGYEGETDIFIYPGYEFRAVDALITNFHLPESTLLMLVCAFAGLDNVLAAYKHAVTEKYRFFSYGDAMFIS